MKPMDLLIRLENDLLQNKVGLQENELVIECWRVFNCTKKRCPAYGLHNIRCWQLLGTFCQKKHLSVKTRLSDCRKCKVFLAATPTPKSRAMEAINNIVFMLNGNDIQSKNENMIIMQKIGVAKERFGLTGKEMAILPMVLGNTRRLKISNDFAISKNTLKTHIRHIFKKMQVRSTSELRKKLLQLEL